MAGKALLKDALSFHSNPQSSGRRRNRSIGVGDVTANLRKLDPRALSLALVALPTLSLLSLHTHTLHTPAHFCVPHASFALHLVGVAFTLRKCELKVNETSMRFRYKRLGGLVWSGWLDLKCAQLIVPSQNRAAESRGFDLKFAENKLTFIACSEETSIALKVALLRAKAAMAPAARASLTARSKKVISIEKTGVKTGAGFLARGPVSMLKMYVADVFLFHELPPTHSTSPLPLSNTGARL